MKAVTPAFHEYCRMQFTCPGVAQKPRETRDPVPSYPRMRFRKIVIKYSNFWQYDLAELAGILAIIIPFGSRAFILHSAQLVVLRKDAVASLLCLRDIFGWLCWWNNANVMNFITFLRRPSRGHWERLSLVKTNRHQQQCMSLTSSSTSVSNILATKYWKIHT